MDYESIHEETQDSASDDVSGFQDASEQSMLAAHRPDYDDLRERAASEGRIVDEYIALSKSADPFFVRMPSRERDAHWFAEVWESLGRPRGAHLRRLHYQLVSQPVPPSKPDGTPYTNTYDCWTLLNNASRNARYLKLIEPTELTDHRSPPAQIYAVPNRESTMPPMWSMSALWGPPPPLPSINPSVVTWGSNLSVPTPAILGYDYEPADQPFRLELWVEKSTVNDVLAPICRAHGINLVTGVGFLTVIRIVEMLARVRGYGKPCRIFYLSDHDPSGECMPIAVARQCEYWMPDLAPDADLKLEAIALTPEQVASYGLPKTPIKDGHKSKDDFEARHGEGATELDALQAIYPGELARLVSEAIAPYIDRELRGRLEQTRRTAYDIVVPRWFAATTSERAELEAIDAEAREMSESYEEELEELADRFQDDLGPLSDRLSAVWQALLEKARQLPLLLPERPESDMEPPDSEEDWLFASDRDYDEQLAYYKARRPGKTTLVTLLAPIPCEVCGTSFVPPRRSSRHCSRPCRRKQVAAALSEAKRAARAATTCIICGASFEPQRASAKYCSSKCQQVERNRAKVERKKAAS